MRFSTKQDIEASLDATWAALTDFDIWERTAMRHCTETLRTDDLHHATSGMSWRLQFQYRGKERDCTVEIIKISPTDRIVLKVKSGMMDSEIVINLAAMSINHTRLYIAADIRPLSIGARLFMQTLRIVRAQVDRKFDKRVEQIADIIRSHARQMRVVIR